jgi:hypothetical protein
MSNAKNNGDANACGFDGPEHASYGLTKREYFAGLAMQGLTGNPTSTGVFKDCATDAVNYADALLEALEANNEQA